MRRVFITGSNRGIGLEFTRQYLESGWRVYATCRRPAEAAELRTMSRIHTRLSIHRLDITAQEDISRIGRQFAEVPLDLLINTGSVFLDRSTTHLEHFNFDSWLRTFEVNTIGTVRVIDALFPSIRQSMNNVNLIVVITSPVDVDVKYRSPAGIYYRSSKAALNSAMADIADELLERKVGTLMLYPGPAASTTGHGDGRGREEIVSGMIECIRNYRTESNGGLFSCDGLPIQ